VEVAAQRVELDRGAAPVSGERDDQPARRIDPERAAGEAGVAERLARQREPRRARSAAPRPPQGEAAARPPEGTGNRVGIEQRARPEPLRAERNQRIRRHEQPRVPAEPANEAGIPVLRLAAEEARWPGQPEAETPGELDLARAVERAVDRPRRGRPLENLAQQPERREYLAPQEREEPESEPALDQ